MATNLLIDPTCFLFLEGTPYHPEDAYGKTIDVQYHKTPRNRQTYHFTWVPVFKLDPGIDSEGKSRTGEPTTLDEMDLPYLYAQRARADLEACHRQPWRTAINVARHKGRTPATSIQ